MLALVFDKFYDRVKRFLKHCSMCNPTLPGITRFEVTESALYCNISRLFLECLMFDGTLLEGCPDTRHHYKYYCTGTILVVFGQFAINAHTSIECWSVLWGFLLQSRPHSATITTVTFLSQKTIECCCVTVLRYAPSIAHLLNEAQDHRAASKWKPCGGMWQIRERGVGQKSSSSHECSTTLWNQGLLGNNERWSLFTFCSSEK